MSVISYYRILPEGIYLVKSDRPNWQIYEVQQVHGDHIVDCHREAPLSEGDGVLFSLQSPTPLIAGIKTADCLPVLLLSEDSGALIHAGWKGLQKKILKHPLVRAMKIHTALIGPAICAHCYEVSDDFKENFPNSRAFLSDKEGSRFDLAFEAKSQLLDLNPKLNLIESQQCTFEGRFHSYRRDSTIQRNWNLFIPSTHPHFSTIKKRIEQQKAVSDSTLKAFKLK